MSQNLGRRTRSELPSSCTSLGSFGCLAADQRNSHNHSLDCSSCAKTLLFFKFWLPSPFAILFFSLLDPTDIDCDSLPPRHASQCLSELASQHVLSSLPNPFWARLSTMNMFLSLLLNPTHYEPASQCTPEPSPLSMCFGLASRCLTHPGLTSQCVSQCIFHHTVPQLLNPRLKQAWGCNLYTRDGNFY